MKKYNVVCTKCKWSGFEKDTFLGKDKNGIIKEGCPICKTDEFLVIEQFTGKD